MRLIMKACKSIKKGIGSQRGFTLTEIVIVLIISALLLVGSSQIVYHMTVTSAKDRAKADALCQVQYVGFWISEDVMQAKYEGVDFSGNSTDPLANHFPIIITWTEWDGDTNRVKFSLLPKTLREVYRYMSSPGSVGSRPREALKRTRERLQ